MTENIACLQSKQRENYSINKLHHSPIILSISDMIWNSVSW